MALVGTLESKLAIDRSKANAGLDSTVAEIKNKA